MDANMAGTECEAFLNREDPASDSDDSGSSVTSDLGPDDDASPGEVLVDLAGDPGNGTKQLEVSGIPSDLNGLLFVPRAYQLEMFEESLKRNIIVAVGCSYLVANR
jgi:hypothetical protein